MYPPRSLNPDLTPLYFTAVFIGAKNKRDGLVKMIKNYESQPINDTIYSTIKTQSEEAIIINNSDNKLSAKIEEIANEKTN